MKSIILLILTIVTISIAIPFNTKNVIESDQKDPNQDCGGLICPGGCCPIPLGVCCPNSNFLKKIYGAATRKPTLPKLDKYSSL